MLTILAAWTLAGLGFTGVGLLAARGLGVAQPPRAAAAFWLGWAACVEALQLVQLAVPIGPAVAGVIAAAALAGWAIARPRWTPRGPVERIATALVLAAALVLAWLCLDGCGNGDSGIYHLPSVRWFTAARLAPGMANLNPLLGLQSSHFLLLALFESSGLAHRSHHVLPGLLLLALIAQGVFGTARVIQKGSKANARDWAALTMLAVVVDQLRGHDVTSFSPDLAVAVVGAALWIEFLGAILGSDESRQDELPRPLLVLFALAASTQKLSLAPLALLVAAWAILDGLRHRTVSLRFAAAAALAVGALDRARSVIVSGYPLYPQSWLALPVSWRVPVATAERVHRFVLAWGRWSGGPRIPVIDTWQWLDPWLTVALTRNREVILPLALAAFGLLLTALGWRGLRARVLPAFVFPWVALALWFVTAPDFRFAGAAPWMAATACIVAAAVSPSTSVQGGRALAVGLLIAALYPLLEPLPRATPAPRWLALSPAPLPAVETLELRTGGTVRYGEKCWDTPPPCTSFPRRGLELRVPGDELSGFTWGTERPGDELKSELVIPDIH